jgi:hypothetical protein
MIFILERDEGVDYEKEKPSWVENNRSLLR